MAKTLRVHILAKDLGVQSKAIVAKCQDEGVPGIENHMSVVKIGLAETIRQWFSSGEVAEGQDTAVETSERVDIEKVRRRKEAAAEAGGDFPAEVAVATDVVPEEVASDIVEVEEVVELPAEVIAEVPEVEVAPEVDVEEEPVAEALVAEPVVESEPQPPEVVAAPPVTPPVAVARPVAPPVAPLGVANVPTRPAVVKPAGEQLTAPKKAEMRGPRVIRVEQPDPDPIRAPRPRRGGPAGGAPGAAGGGMVPDGNVEGVSRSRGPARGGGVRGAGGPVGAGGGTPGAAEQDAGRKGGGAGGKRRALSSRRGRSAESMLTGPTTFSKADLDELDARLRGSAGFVKKRRQGATTKGGGGGGFQAQSAVQTGGKVEVAEPITIKGLSSATGIKTADIIKFLFRQGVMATINSAIETDAAMEICLDYDIELEVKAMKTAEERVEQEFADREMVDERSRPPVVTILGHVDHGKTSLLDRIRKADVAAHEDGGITQHVGAYRVTVTGSDGQDKTVVFLDTPGHAAFTAMRARGARMTDIVVLLVASDDGVMPQTIESINHAKAAGVPVVVALNKCDLPSFNEDKLQKIYGQLAEHGLNPSAWGGETEVVQTSAHTGKGVTELLEILDLQAEMLELKADFGGPARGTVIEAEMQSGRGSVARVLIQDGFIRVGDFIVSGRAFGRVRDMTNDRGQRITEAGPATPLEISGIDEIPDAGDKLFVTASLKKAEEVAQQYRDTERERMLASKSKVTLANFAETLKAGQVKELRVVLKCDVQGSVETLVKSLEELGNNEVAVKVIHAAVGGVTESDVLLADASDAVVIGFHVNATPAVRDIAEQRSVDIQMYRVIYDVTDSVKKSLEGMLTPEIREEELGIAQVKQVFRIGGVGAVAGCLVIHGSIVRSEAKIRVVRGGVVVTDERKLESLRRVKDEAKEVRMGTECGIRIDGFNDVKVDDQIVCYKTLEVARKLD